MAATLREANKPSDLNQPCEQGEDNRSSDLCAQWKAADAARSSADAAWLFGALGSLIGALTLAAAAAAAIWARKAANETQTANKQFRSQSRAKIIQRDLSFFMPAEKPVGERWCADVGLDLENVGDTSAHKIKVVVTCYFYKRRTRLNRMRKTEYCGSLAAAAVHTVDLRIPILLEDCETVVKQQPDRVLIHVDRSFMDIFDETHQEEFWYIGRTRDKRDTVSDHIASTFTLTDAGFLDRTLALGTKRTRSRRNKGLSQTESNDTGHHGR